MVVRTREGIKFLLHRKIDHSEIFCDVKLEYANGKVTITFLNNSETQNVIVSFMGD